MTAEVAFREKIVAINKKYGIEELHSQCTLGEIMEATRVFIRELKDAETVKLAKLVEPDLEDLATRIRAARAKCERRTYLEESATDILRHVTRGMWNRVKPWEPYYIYRHSFERDYTVTEDEWEEMMDIVAERFETAGFSTARLVREVTGHGSVWARCVEMP